MSTEDEVWYIPEHLVEIPHINIVNKSQISSLRPADPIEIGDAENVEYKDPLNRKDGW